MDCTQRIVSVVLVLFTGALGACSAADRSGSAKQKSTIAQDQTNASPPPRIRAWMDRLTVEHEYDPETGFIVAREVIELPEVIRSGPPASEAVRMGERESRVVVVFATADRCAPCQQYKKSALNDPRVVSALGEPRFIATHIEVDRESEQAEAVLGSLAIPMTYAFSKGEQVATLRGQRSADELLDWLDQLGQSE